jgi:photosystem II stability/assembly factor-like uncharacterized protein
MLAHRAVAPADFRRIFVSILTLSLLAFGESGLAEERAVQAPLASGSLLLDGSAAGDRLVVVGERGHILVSEDGGDSWTQAHVPTRATLTAVYFHDAELGFAVGHDAIILRTRDGGSTWTMVFSDPAEELLLLDVWFDEPRHGFAIGAYGYFVETRDGGDTWQRRQISEDDFHLNSITASGERLYIAAEAGVVYRSDDGGETWMELPSPYEGSFFGALALDGDEMLLFGLRGHLFRSEDAGKSWSPIDVDSEALLTDALSLDADTLLVTGMAGTLLISRDQGRHFQLHQQPDRLGIATALDSGDGGVVLVGEFGVRKLGEEQLQ